MHVIESFSAHFINVIGSASEIFCWESTMVTKFERSRWFGVSEGGLLENF